MSAVRVFSALSVVLAVAGCLVMQPTGSGPGAVRHADANLLREQVRIFTEDFGPRYQDRPENLARCREFLIREFRRSGARTEEQIYEVDGREFRNVRAFFGEKGAPRVVVGAHYDTCEENPASVNHGADDNASGVVGLLGLARLLQQQRPNKATVELVAYPAIMITDTAFYRNDNYHGAGDLWQSLDYTRMALGVTQVYQAVLALGE